jgi:hypothetical protein
MEVVEFETLDKGAVEQASHGPACCTPPAHDGAVARSLEAQDRFDGDSRPRELRSDQGASDAIQDHVLGAGLHFLRDVVESKPVQPVGKAAGRSCNVSRALGGTLEAYVDGHDFYLPTLGQFKASSVPGAALLEAGEGLAGHIEANQCSVIAAREYATWLLPRPTPTAANHTNVQCCGHIGATR